MRLGLIVLGTTALWGQSLEVSPVPAARRGGTASFLIKLSSPKGKELVALQWEITAPPEITIDPADVVAGSAAESAGKSMTCAPVKSADHRSACILAGGKNSIADGPVAVVRYNIRPGGGAGTVVVRIDRIIGVTGDLKKVDIASVEGRLTIR